MIKVNEIKNRDSKNIVIEFDGNKEELRKFENFLEGKNIFSFNKNEGITAIFKYSELKQLVEILKKYFEDKKIENSKNIIISEKNIEKAFLKALELRENEDECIFVVGSFYLLGEVKKVIEKYF